MIENLKKNFALYLLKKKYLKRIDNETNKKDFIKNSNSFLVIMPENDEDYRHGYEIAKYLKIHKKKVSLVLPDFKYSLVDKHLNFELITYGLKSRNSLNMPGKALIEKLDNKKFDVVIDLSRMENIFSTGLSLLPETNIRVGLNKEKTNNFFNVRFNLWENNSEISYRNLLNSLSMF